MNRLYGDLWDAAESIQALKPSRSHPNRWASNHPIFVASCTGLQEHLVQEIWCISSMPIVCRTCGLTMNLTRLSVSVLFNFPYDSMIIVFQGVIYFDNLPVLHRLVLYGGHGFQQCRPARLKRRFYNPKWVALERFLLVILRYLRYPLSAILTWHGTDGTTYHRRAATNHGASQWSCVWMSDQWNMLFFWRHPVSSIPSATNAYSL